jgi:2-polyprenyl-3-methyl-5-hydroxy-6-metoxy-1,4-benzoquinol methylase
MTTQIYKTISVIEEKKRREEKSYEQVGSWSEMAMSRARAKSKTTKMYLFHHVLLWHLQNTHQTSHIDREEEHRENRREQTENRHDFGSKQTKKLEKEKHNTSNSLKKDKHKGEEKRNTK